MALREIFVERFRGVRSARLALDQTTVLIGENDCGTSSLLEALAFVLSPQGGRPRLEPSQVYRASRPPAAEATGPVRIQLTFGETRAGSWDRPELEALAPVLGPGGGRPRTLVVELTAPPAADHEPVDAGFEIRSPGGGKTSRDDLAVLNAVRRMNPLVWLRRGGLVSTGLPEEREIEAGYVDAERLLAQWAPGAHARRLGARAPVAEILGRALEPPARRSRRQRARPASSTQKLGVFLLTARLFEQLWSGAAPGVRPIIVIEEPEAGLHPMTLASVWGLFERLATQKIVTTHSGTLLSAAPLRSLRRLVRDADGIVSEWRVRPGALGKDELRKVSYHLRARRGAASFARCWLLVEGETEFWVLPDLARLCGYDLVQEGVACVEYAQCGVEPLVKLARELGIEWHVLTDGDRAGETYARVARAFAGGVEESRRLSRLSERDIEHCFWRHGHARAFELLAGFRSGPSAPPGRVIEKAIDRHSKPGVAFELLASVAATGSAGPPPPLRRTIETCIALARGGPGLLRPS